MSEWQSMDCVICGRDHGWRRKIEETEDGFRFRFRTTICPETGLVAKAIGSVAWETTDE